MRRTWEHGFGTASLFHDRYIPIRSSGWVHGDRGGRPSRCLALNMHWSDSCTILAPQVCCLSYPQRHDRSPEHGSDAPCLRNRTSFTSAPMESSSEEEEDRLQSCAWLYPSSHRLNSLLVSTIFLLPCLSCPVQAQEGASPVAARSPAAGVEVLLGHKLCRATAGRPVCAPPWH